MSDTEPLECCPVPPTSMEERIGRGWSDVLWSRAVFGAGTAFREGQFFTYGIGTFGGGSALPATELDTNLRCGSFTPCGRAFTVDAIRYRIFGGTEADIDFLVQRTWMNWRFTQSEMSVAPLAFFWSEPKNGGRDGVFFYPEIPEKGPKQDVFMLPRIPRPFENGNRTIPDNVWFMLHLKADVREVADVYVFQESVTFRVALLGHYVSSP